MKSHASKIGLLLSVGALALLFSRVSFRDLGASLAAADPAWLAASFAIFFVMFVVRALRWATLLGGTPLGTTWHANVIGYMINILLPLRLGELARAYVIGKKTEVRMARALSAVVVERIIDLASVLVLFAIFARRVPMRESFTRAATLGSVFVIVCVAVAALVVAKGEAVEAALRPRLERKAGAASADRWLGRLRDVREGFKAVGSAPRLLHALGLTVVVWAATIASAAACMRAFLPTDLDRSGLVVVMANLGGALPAAPGGLGIVQGFATSALVVPYGIPEGTALAFVLVWSLGQQLVLVALGALSLGRVGMRWDDIRAGAARAAVASPD